MKPAAPCAWLLGGMLAAGVPTGWDRAAAAQTRDRGGAAASEVPGGADRSRARSYDAGGRRNPFVRPSSGGGPAPAAAPRPPGLAGIAVDELTLRGIVRFGGAHLAVIEAGNGRSHLLRGGEELFDGAVESVNALGVLVVLDGPGGAARAVRLTLRPPSGER